MKNIFTIFDDPETTVFIGTKKDIKDMVYTFLNSYKNGREMIGNRILRNETLENIIFSLLSDRDVPYITNEDLIKALDIKIKEKLDTYCPECIDDFEVL